MISTQALPQVRGEKYDFYLTKSFKERLKKILGGGIYESRSFVVNVLENSKALNLAEVGETFTVRFMNYDIIGKKDSEDTVTFSTILTNY